MTCEKAEEHLSAYLDDMLEPPLHEEVRTHVEGCVHCREVLADYRRFELLLAATPRIAPAAALHDRIFDSPEMAAILRSQRGEAGRAARRRLLRPVPWMGEHEEPEARGAREAQAEHAAPAWLMTRFGGAPPGWARVALQSAAVFLLLFGSALLVRQGLLHSGTTSTHGSSQTISGPTSNGIPLAAGPRVVYAARGTLWSVAEYGPELAQRLTPQSVSVSRVWAVSAAGDRVAYVDEQTGTIHVVRSDGQSDQVVGQMGHQCGFAGVPVPCATGMTVPHLAWAPDGAQIAYTLQTQDGQSALALINADGSNPRTISIQAGASVDTILWSPDSLQVAFVRTARAGQTGQTGQTLWTYDLVTKQSRVLASQADGATMSKLAWLSDPLRPTLTWAAASGETITGVYSVSLLGNAGVLRLTPVGAHYSVTDFSAARDGGTWALASTASGSVETVSAATSGGGRSTPVAQPVSTLVWSPVGDALAIVSASGDIAVWTPGSTPVASVLGTDGTIAWSQDGRYLALHSGRSIRVVTIANGSVSAPMTLERAQGDAALLWATDSKSLAVASATGLTLVSADGAQFKLADPADLAHEVLAWSVAG